MTDASARNNDGPVAAIVAVPDDAVAELVARGLAAELPPLRGPVLDAVVTIGVDSAALVTLLQTPQIFRAFADWIKDRVRRQPDHLDIRGSRSGRSIELRVTGDVPVDAVTQFLTAAFDDEQAVPDDENTQ